MRNQKRTAMLWVMTGVLGCGLALGACAKMGSAPMWDQPSGAAPAMVVDGEHPGHNTEAYARIDENPFVQVATQPLSTFSVDVDTASYANVRRFLTDGRLPPKDAVRIEELINYFGYDYPQPSGDDPFSVTAEVSACPWKPEHKLVRIGLQGRTIEQGRLPPRNLVFLLDVSGSMGSPRKLPLLKGAMKLLVEGLTERDHVAMVVYAGASGLVLPPTSGADRGRILEALDRLQSGGSTNGGAGIALAYKVARQNFRADGINRVILATDGDFNVGTTSHGDLTRMIEQERNSGVFLTVLGLGTGNLKDSTMEALADRGNGNYAYIDSMAEARKVLVAEAGATLVTIAKDVKIQVEFNPARVRSYRLIGYENRLLRAEDFNDDTKDAGEIGAGHSVTALYQIVPAEAAPVATAGDRKIDPLRYQGAREASAQADSSELMTVKLRYKRPTEDVSQRIVGLVDDADTPVSAASDDQRWAAAVASYGMLLRGSGHAGDAGWRSVRSMAEGALGRDANGYRREFLRLAERAASLARAD